MLTHLLSIADVRRPGVALARVGHEGAAGLRPVAHALTSCTLLAVPLPVPEAGVDLGKRGPSCGDFVPTLDHKRVHP